MVDIILMTAFQAYPMYMCAIPFIIIGLMIMKVRNRIKKQQEIYLERVIFIILCTSVLLILAATCYSPEFFACFDVTNLTDVKNIHFDPKGFLNNILLNSMSGSLHSIINWAGNILLFVPIGFSAMWLSRREKYIKFCIVALCLFFSISIELTQLCCGRLADVIDVILNTAGGFIGCWLFVYFMAVTENLGGRYNSH